MLIVIGILAVLAALVLLVFVLMGRSRARTAAAYAAAGFVPAVPDGALHDAVLSLWTQKTSDPNVKLQLLGVHRLEGSGAETYSVRVRRTVHHTGVEHGRYTTTEARGVLVRSPRLAGPAFELIPKAAPVVSAAGGGGFVNAMAQLADQAAQAALAQFGPAVELDDAEFAARYFVVAAQDAPVRAFLTPERRRALLGVEAAEVSNRAGLFLVRRPAGEILQRGEPLEARLRSDLETAQRLLAILSS